MNQRQMAASIWLACLAAGGPRTVIALTPGTHQITATQTLRPLPRSRRPHAAPALTSYLTPAQRTEYLRAIEANLAAAQGQISALRMRVLAADRQRTVNRAEAFIRQANESRKADDLPAAQGFAWRAYLLSRDLLRRR